MSDPCGFLFLSLNLLLTRDYMFGFNLINEVYQTVSLSKICKLRKTIPFEKWLKIGALFSYFCWVGGDVTNCTEWTNKLLSGPFLVESSQFATFAKVTYIPFLSLSLFLFTHQQCPGFLMIVQHYSSPSLHSTSCCSESGWFLGKPMTTPLTDMKAKT